MGVVLWGQLQNNDSSELYIYPESEFGNYLAIKHAIWVDDFDSVINLSNRLKASGVSSVQVDVAIGRFLSEILIIPQKYYQVKNITCTNRLYNIFIKIR